MREAKEDGGRGGRGGGLQFLAKLLLVYLKQSSKLHEFKEKTFKLHFTCLSTKSMRHVIIFSLIARHV